MLRRILPVVLAIGIIAGCAEEPKDGVVISTKYNAAHYDTVIYCARYDSKGICSLYLPDNVFVEDEWSLKLRNTKQTGWRVVGEPEYRHCDIGAKYPECALTGL